MASIRVQVPDYGTYIDFPEGTPPEVIQGAMEQNFPKKSSQWTQKEGTEGKNVADLQKEFINREGSLTTRLKNTPSGGYKEPLRLAAETGTMTLNALGRGLKSVASTVQGGGEAIRNGLDAGLQKYAEKQAEFQPLQSPMEPSTLGTIMGEGVSKGINKLSDLTGRPDIVEPVAQGVMDIGALVGLNKARPAIGEAVKAGVTGTRNAVVNAIPDTVEMSMYQRGLKGQTGFTGLKTAELNKRLNTALDEGIGLNEKGLEKSKSTVRSINDEVSQRISEYADQGATVDVGKVLAPVADVRAKVAGEAFPAKPRAAVQGTVNEFVREQAPQAIDPATNITTPSEIPLAKAQTLKQSINRELTDFYEAMTKSPDKSAFLAKQWVMRTKAKIGDGLRNEISDIFPEVKELNAREGALIQLNKSLERAVNRIGQRDVISLKFLTALMTSPKMALTEFVLNNPSIQSSLAIALRNARNKANPKASATVPASSFTPQAPQAPPAYTPVPRSLSAMEPQFIYTRQK